MKRCSNKVPEEAARAKSGEEDPIKLCTAEAEEGRIGSGLPRCTTTAVVISSKEVAAATANEDAGDGPAPKEGSAKRKAAAGSSKGKKAAAGPPAEDSAAAAGDVLEGVKDAADVAMATAEDTGVDDWIPGQLIELPKKYVDWILRQKRHVLEEDPDEYYNRMINDPDRPDVFTPEFLEEERQLMRDIAEQYRLSDDRLEKFQEWVRDQLKTKGRVLVDDNYLANRAEYRQAFVEEFGALWQDV